MPDASQFVGNSIEQLLVSLADGVREAQSALNNGPLLDANGRPLTAYHLPYLDFTIQVDMETRTSDTKGGRPVALLFKPVASSSNSSQRISSTITGRLVATPPANGLPAPRIRLSVADRIDASRQVALQLALTNSAGERLVGQQVELNIDDADTRALSGSGFRRGAGTRLVDAMLTSDDAGGASSALAIDPADMGKNAMIAVVASIGPYEARATIPLNMAHIA